MSKVNKQQDPKAQWTVFSNNEYSKFFLTILDAIQEGIELVDAAGIVRYVNPAFEAIMGIKPAERIGKSIIEIVPDGPLAQVVRTGRFMPGERFYVADANIDMVASASPIVVDGTMMGAVTVFSDFIVLSHLMERLEKSIKAVDELKNRLSEAMSAKYSFSDIIGNSLSLHNSIKAAKRSATTEAIVLLLGETGTGKELFAHSIHDVSQRRKHPFVKVNCAAIPENLLESELFGYEKGAFTGAVHRKLGMFDLADKGTIFLDEIGELGLPLQTKLLRVLEEGEMYRIGGTSPVILDVRIIAATNRDLYQLVQEGRFRQDLYYRIKVLTIELPPLRERKDDIVQLVDYFINLFNHKHGKKIRGVSESAKSLLGNYRWPGNVRELRNTLQQAAIMAEGDEITARELEPLFYAANRLSPDDPLVSVHDMERQLIETALSKYGHSLDGKKKAAEALNISLRTLYNKIQKYQLNT